MLAVDGGSCVTGGAAVEGSSGTTEGVTTAAGIAESGMIGVATAAGGDWVYGGCCGAVRCGGAAVDIAGGRAEAVGVVVA
jgi:hypothetical protein